MSVITKLTILYDPLLLWEDCLKIISKYGWGTLDQISVTHRPETLDTTDRIFEGGGSLRGTGHKEKDFSIFNSELRGTYLETVFKSLPFEIGRCRLMKVKPKTCYSVHRDATMRIHLPLITNPDCLMIWPDQNLVAHLPVTGNVYLTNTTMRHTAMNGGLDDRYHLVGALCES